MSRKRSFQTALLALSLFVGFALATSAVARPGHGPGHHGRSLERQIEKLDLPAETRAAVQAVLDESRTARDALREQLHTAHESMRALLEQDAVDEAAVMAQADAIGALMTQHRKQELATLIRVRGLLTPEQREQLDLQMAKRRGHGGRHAGHHARHGAAGECQHDEAGRPAQPSEEPADSPGDVQS